MQLLKNLPTFYGTQRFITAITTDLHWSLQVEPTQLVLIFASCCTYFTKFVRRSVPPNNFSRCLFYIFLPLHVSALAGHLQAEYTIIPGSYLTTDQLGLFSVSGDKDYISIYGAQLSNFRLSTAAESRIMFRIVTVMCEEIVEAPV
jgi:hypothetical protein